MQLQLQQQQHHNDQDNHNNDEDGGIEANEQKGVKDTSAVVALLKCCKHSKNTHFGGPRGGKKENSVL